MDNKQALKKNLGDFGLTPAERVKRNKQLAADAVAKKMSEAAKGAQSNFTAARNMKDNNQKGSLQAKNGALQAKPSTYSKQQPAKAFGYRGVNQSRPEDIKDRDLEALANQIKKREDPINVPIGNKKYGMKGKKTNLQMREEQELAMALQASIGGLSLESDYERQIAQAMAESQGQPVQQNYDNELAQVQRIAQRAQQSTELQQAAILAESAIMARNEEQMMLAQVMAQTKQQFDPQAEEQQMASILAASMNDVVVDPNARNIDDMSYEQLMELGEKVGDVSKGLSQTDINRIQSHKWAKGETKFASCTICMDNFSENCEFKRIKCGHEFCAECIDEWLFNQKSCPICKETAL